jgi:ribosomal protein S6E (S10)
MPQVRNGTGYSRGRTRTADALAMGLWPSRGLELLGFELKSDRADWLREKCDPAKAEEIGKFCDRWWMVVGAEGVVQQDDLFPPTWGLMVAVGGKLKVVRDAPKLNAEPLDREQLAAILRRAAECVVPRAEITAELERAKEKAESHVRELVTIETLHLRHELDRMRERVDEFEKKSGLSIHGWQLGDIAEAAKFIAGGGLANEERRLRDLAATAKEITLALEARGMAMRAGVPGSVRRRIMRRDGYRCRKCGLLGREISHGGGSFGFPTSVPGDLRVLCTRCNTLKGTKVEG